MSVELYVAFVFAVVVLIATPGPVVALVVTTSVRHGVRRGLATVAGSSSAMALHLVLVCFGLAAVLARLGEAVFWIKWIGAAYLLYLGVRALNEKAAPPADSPARGNSARRAFGEGFLVSAFNPKPLIFYAAFFPLFITAESAILPQLLLMSATFFVIGVALDSAWAIAASRARSRLARAGRWMNRVTGGVLIVAAAALAGLRKA